MFPPAAADHKYSHAPGAYLLTPECPCLLPQSLLYVAEPAPAGVTWPTFPAAPEEQLTLAFMPGLPGLEVRPLSCRSAGRLPTGAGLCAQLTEPPGFTSAGGAGRLTQLGAGPEVSFDDPKAAAVVWPPARPEVWPLVVV